MYQSLSKSKDSGTSKACPRLQLHIVSIKSKTKQASSASINFATRSTKTTNSLFKKLPKRTFQNKYRNRKIHEHKLRCNYCREIGHTTPHCHAMKVLAPKGIMMWVPKQSTFVTNLKDSTFVGGLRIPN